MRNLIRLAVVATALTGSLASAQPVIPEGPTFTEGQIRSGTTLNAEECAAYSSTVYVTNERGGLCLRYYLSMVGGQADQAIFFLDGDRSPAEVTYDQAKLGRLADHLSKEYRRPAVYLARMGLEGSSGWHGDRRTSLEVRATDLAITAISERHAFKRIHLIGQSGGAHLSAALVGRRQDIGCAVLGSGGLWFGDAYHERQAQLPPDRRHYDPGSALAQIVAQSKTTRILVVTDPDDQVVSAEMQTTFVDLVQTSGGRISQFLVTLPDEKRHNATLYSLWALGGCLSRKPDTDIRERLDRLTQQRSASRNVEPQPSP